MTMYWRKKNGLISENPEISYIGQKSIILNPYSSAVPQPHRALPRFALWFRLCSALNTLICPFLSLKDQLRWLSFHGIVFSPRPHRIST